MKMKQKIETSKFPNNSSKSLSGIDSKSDFEIVMESRAEAQKKSKKNVISFRLLKSNFSQRDWEQAKKVLQVNKMKKENEIYYWNKRE